MSRLDHHSFLQWSLPKSRFNFYYPRFSRPSFSSPTLLFTTNTIINQPYYLSKNHQNLLPIPRSSPKNQNPFPILPTTFHGCDNDVETVKNQDKSFWGAVGLIIGTAVGPGMLGLPAATIKSGPFPSTIAILLSWVYVISSIILVAELSFAAMEEDEVAEVSFTALATKALGSRFGAFVAIIYASLSFSLLVACVSGIGSIVSQWFPAMKKSLLLAHALFPLFVGILLGFFPFKAIDVANRLLCFLMLVSITVLVTIGLVVARTNILASFSHASWSTSAILPAIPVTVLTLGFHVITPFICKIAGNSVSEARKAILIGGVVPLVMVLSWNLIVLGLAGTTSAAAAAPGGDPISLLLSVNPSALSAVQGFAFAALATSLIGYAVSFPKQLVDTLKLILSNPVSIKRKGGGHGGRVGFVIYAASAGVVSFGGSKIDIPLKGKQMSSSAVVASLEKLVMTVVLVVPVFIASFFPSTFSVALDFAGVYANCFLFGILPPLMAYIYQSQKKLRLSTLPGAAGDGALLLLFAIAVILGIWH